MAEPRKPGRKPHMPTAEQRRSVKAMAAYGVPEPDISKVLGIGEKTLRKYYKEELSKAHIEANARVAENLYRIATSDRGKETVTAAIFWMKTRAGWRETVRLENSGPNGGPLQHDHRISPGSLDGISDDELVRRYQEAVRAAGRGGG